ncbi:MAG: hypothetical protein V5B36_00870 [Candidatus Accumulibacter sp. UW25]|jgi:hypothetical protein
MENEQLAISNEVVTNQTIEEQTTNNKEDDSLDAVIAKAMEKHAPSDVEPEKTAPEVQKTALPEQKESVPEAPEAPEKRIDPISGRELAPIKAPASLTPALREKWSKVDPQFQQYWADRERDIATKLNDTAEERKLAHEIKEITAPYEPILRQFGVSATAHIKELFNLSHSLNTGTPQQKAQIIYNLINHFKPDAETLGGLFNGKPVQQQPAQQPVNVQSEVERILAEREEQAVQARGESAIAKFSNDPSNEFFEDVKVMMGKAIDSGFVTGGTEDELLANAYKFACNHHDEIRSILEQRKATQPVQQVVQQPVQQPVKSVKPSLGSGKSVARPQTAISMDDAIETAMKKHGWNQ